MSEQKVRKYSSTRQLVPVLRRKRIPRDEPRTFRTSITILQTNENIQTPKSPTISRELPINWRKAKTTHGDTYYINDSLMITSWEAPLNDPTNITDINTINNKKGNNNNKSSQNNNNNNNNNINYLTTTEYEFYEKAFNKFLLDIKNDINKLKKNNNNNNNTSFKIKMIEYGFEKDKLEMIDGFVECLELNLDIKLNNDKLKIINRLYKESQIIDKYNIEYETIEGNYDIILNDNYDIISQYDEYEKLDKNIKINKHNISCNTNINCTPHKNDKNCIVM